MFKNGVTAGAAHNWLFTLEELSSLRQAAHDRVVQTICLSLVPLEREPGFLELEEESWLVRYCAEKIPELCSLCGASAEVLWTAIIFYQRFFCSKSPMEFDPVPMMFACVHVACKVEEMHEITLDKLLAAAECGVDTQLRSNISSLELPLLEGIGFQLLVEPKPDTALRMLVGELQRSLNLTGSALAVSELAWEKVIIAAEKKVLDLCFRTDAVLRWPASVVIAGTLRAEFTSFSLRFGLDAERSVAIVQAILDDVLYTQLADDPQREATRTMMRGISQALASLEQPDSNPVPEDIFRRVKEKATRYNRLFDRMRKEAVERHEANRLERKRRWSEVKGAVHHHAPVPIAVQSSQCFGDVNHRLVWCETDGSMGDVLHRIREEDYEDTRDT